MSAADVLALWLADDADAGTTAEFARVAAAAAAAGRTVRLLDLRGAHARASPLPAEVERHLHAVLDASPPATAPNPAHVREALRGARSVLRLASPARSASPPLLRVTDAWLRATPDDELLQALRDAGQVVRV